MIHDFVLLNGILTDPEPQAAIRQMSAEIKARLSTSSNGGSVRRPQAQSSM